MISTLKKFKLVELCNNQICHYMKFTTKPSMILLFFRAESDTSKVSVSCTPLCGRMAWCHTLETPLRNQHITPRHKIYTESLWWQSIQGSDFCMIAYLSVCNRKTQLIVPPYHITVTTLSGVGPLVSQLWRCFVLALKIIDCFPQIPFSQV